MASVHIHFELICFVSDRNRNKNTLGNDNKHELVEIPHNNEALKLKCVKGDVMLEMLIEY